MIYRESDSRLILFDKRGTGLSDAVPIDQLPMLEQRMDDVRAVMDAAGSERGALMGTSEGSSMNLLFAATHPTQTEALILVGSYARLSTASDYPSGTPTEISNKLLDRIDREWGTGVMLGAIGQATRTIHRCGSGGHDTSARRQAPGPRWPSCVWPPTATFALS